MIHKPSIRDIIRLRKPPHGKRIKDVYSYNPIPHTIPLSGEWRVQRFYKGKILLYDSGWFNNVITNVGLDALFSNSTIEALTSRFAVGTDNTAADETDTTLGSQVGSRTSTAGPNNGTHTAGPDAKYYEYLRVLDFGQGAVEGNITEVGAFSENSGGIMWSRQVLPVTLVFASPNSDILRLSYRVRLYTGIGDVDSGDYFDPEEYNIDVVTNPVGPVTVSTDIASRAYDIDVVQTYQNFATSLRAGGGFNGAPFGESNSLPNITDARTGSAMGNNNFGTNWSSYTPGDHFRDQTLEIGTGIANFTLGIGNMIGWGTPTSGTAGHASNYKRISVFDPHIPKDATRVATFIERITFARRTPNDPS